MHLYWKDTQLDYNQGARFSVCVLSEQAVNNFDELASDTCS